MIYVSIERGFEGVFDRQKVIKATDKGIKRVLMRLGSFVRTTARQSMKKATKRTKGKKPRKKKAAIGPLSPAGQPPRSHKDLIRKFLVYAWDDTTKSVVIGPRKLGGVVDDNELSALEYGGISSRVDPKTRKKSRISVKAHPFMGPALDANISEVPRIIGEIFGPG